MNTELYQSKQEAEEAGYAGFNQGPHLAVDLEAGKWQTISVRNGEQMVTFSFIPRHDNPEKMGCCDVCVHREKKTEAGNSIQQGAFLGEGPTNACCSLKDESPTTLITISMQD